MRVPIFQIDAFADRAFAGNPAAVMLLNAFFPDRMLQAIAAENNLAETAFLVPSDDDYLLRWFTPTVEVPLCGHATLASAAAIMERIEPGRSQVVFHTASGPLTVTRRGAGYVMDFPVRRTREVPLPHLSDALGAAPVKTFDDGFNQIALLEDAESVRSLAPNLDAIAKFDVAGVIVTAKGDPPFDFVSRYFAPAKGIAEDPVTGGAHCALAHLWSTLLGKTTFRAYQASARGGEVVCRLIGDRVELEGKCVLYLQGQAELAEIDA
jgi:predicted PhzF superfamily epimerase YddE/YHI9